jgi:hypothetical protein
VAGSLKAVRARGQDGLRGPITATEVSEVRTGTKATNCAWGVPRGGDESAHHEAAQALTMRPDLSATPDPQSTELARRNWVGTPRTEAQCYPSSANSAGRNPMTSVRAS